jgi:mRNA-degrading endonuclease RelE of RelBE toxin-antitoxin system
MSIEPLRSVRDHLSEFVDRVQNEHERIVLTRNGHAAAVWFARRGTYRVLYRIRDDLHEVIILWVEHRRDVYRPL